MSIQKNMLEVPKLLELPSSTEASIVRNPDRGTLGVAVRGARFVCPLPKGYTEHSQVADFFGVIVVVHPGLPPLLLDTERGRCVEVDFARIQAEAQAANQNRLVS